MCAASRVCPRLAAFMGAAITREVAGPGRSVSLSLKGGLVSDVFVNPEHRMLRCQAQDMERDFHCRSPCPLEVAQNGGLVSLTRRILFADPCEGRSTRQLMRGPHQSGDAGKRSGETRTDALLPQPETGKISCAHHLSCARLTPGVGTRMQRSPNWFRPELACLAILSDLGTRHYLTATLTCRE